MAVTKASGVDMNGLELILDADADTSITADTDDQIDIKIAGADDFQFTANTFTAASGSTIAAKALTTTTIVATGDVSPAADSSYDLGTSSAAWAEVYMDHLYVGFNKLSNVTLHIGNASGTMQHRMGAGGLSNQDSVNIDFINANNQSVQTTPTGTDADTAMAFGGKISTSYTASFFLDTAAQVLADAMHIEGVAQNSLATTTICQVYGVNHNINGTTRIRPWFYFTDSANDGTAIAINTTNWASGEYVVSNLLGFFKV